MATMTLPLLTTKLYLPQAPGALVERPLLCAKLAAGLAQGARLILIAAPAGFGKSTLAAAWLRAQTIPVAWLALDAQDNEPLAFCTYLLAAIQRAVPGFATELLAQLQGGAPPSPALFCAQLLNALDRLGQPLLIALDDYHLITHPAVHECMADLLRASLLQSQRLLVPALHRQASAWFAAQGLINEAMTHAVAANDVTTAASLVNAHWMTLLHRGESSTILRWLAALPPASFDHYPALHNAYAWALFLKGEVAAVEPHLQQAEQVLQTLCQTGQLHITDADYCQASASIQVLRAFVLYAQRALPAAYAQAQRALPGSRLAGPLLEGDCTLLPRTSVASSARLLRKSLITAKAAKAAKVRQRKSFAKLCGLRVLAGQTFLLLHGISHANR